MRMLPADGVNGSTISICLYGMIVFPIARCMITSLSPASMLIGQKNKQTMIGAMQMLMYTYQCGSRHANAGSAMTDVVTKMQYLLSLILFFMLHGFFIVDNYQI